MTRANLLIAIAIAVISSSIWAFVNQPGQEPRWPPLIQGFSFSPFRDEQSAIDHILPSEEEIDADLALLSKKTHAVRTYTLEGSLAEIPRLASKHGLNVTLGAWLSSDLEKNDLEIETAVKVIQANPKNIIRVIVGNESLLRGDLTPEQLISYIDRIQREVAGIPISTAEPWHIWMKYPELSDHVDFIATHMLPYWEGIEMAQAIDYIVKHMNMLQQRFPNKQVIIGEVGWPSNGRTRQLAEASPANQAIFLRRFLAKAAQEKYTYYIMEAFDQPWKQGSEGSVGAYWGVYDVNRLPKFPFTDPIVRIPEWRLLAGISAIIAIITFAFLLIDSKTLRTRGRSFLATIAFAAATGAVWIVYTYTRQYLNPTTIFIGILMVIGMIGVVVVLLAEAHEWAEATWLSRWRRPFAPQHLENDQLPMVSIHVPAYNEPPDMLIETLNALAQLDYPRYEVLVIDNNTLDPEVWQPVEAHCHKLGAKFRFFHVSPLTGFKAGALNFVLKNTAPEAELLAVIDSDYIVTPDWLRDMAPQFATPSIAIAQAPQDYRDDGENLFKAMCYAEYKGFFYIGMLTRNERNAIIQHGTMTMVRKSVLQEVGGWAEWCITEDAELGLKIFARGYEATYIPKTYGRGLMPDTFLDFKKQRFRWAYGAVQILRRHANALFFGKQTALTRGQRYHFVAGWIPWLADSLNMFFTVAALGWSLGMVYFPLKVDPPLVILSVMPLALFVFKIGKMIYLYRTRVDATAGQTLASALAGLSLSHTISQAIILGFITKDKPFFRTPKRAKSHALLQALQSAREESLIMISLWLSAICVVVSQGSETTDLLIWILVLLVQSIPYLATVIMALISGFAKTKEKIISNITAPPQQEERLKVEG